MHTHTHIDEYMQNWCNLNQIYRLYHYQFHGCVIVLQSHKLLSVGETWGRVNGISVLFLTTPCELSQNYLKKSRNKKYIYIYI